MRAITIIVGVLLSAVNFAWAADLPVAPAPQAPAVYVPPPPPPFSWTGVYGGVNGGYGFASSSGTATATVPGVGTATASSSATADGGVAGGQFGVNWQTGYLVLGAEGDMQWSGQSKTTISPSCAGACSFTETGGIDWFATVRARVGAAFDRVLIYGTGGLAILNVTDNLSATGFGATANLVSLSDTAIGFAAGAGVEYAITNNITAKIEYLYMQADASANGPIALVGGTVSDTATIKDSIVRAGVNFKYP